MSDPVTVQILINLVASGIEELARRVARVDSDAGDRKQLIAGHVVPNAELASAIDTGLERLGSAEAISEDLGGERLRAFLASPEARQTVTELFTSDFAGVHEASLEQIRAQFVESFILWTDVDRAIAAESGPRLFDVLVEAVGVGLQAAMTHNALPAHDAAEALRHRLVQAQLNNIERNIALLRTPAAPPLRDLLQFEHTYRAQVYRRTRDIVPPNLDRNERKPIDELYVAPRFRLSASSDHGSGVLLSYPEIRDNLHRMVLLGDPGGGKSTFTIKLAHDLAAPAAGGPQRTLTPFLVTLRDYGAAKERGRSILDFIQDEARSSYQLADIQPGSFEYLLRNGRAIVIFDGLDELLDTRHRERVTEDVESFAALYSTVPILVTSRRVGYEQAPLDPSEFPVVQLSEFSDSEVERYAQNWYRLDGELTPNEQEERVRGFIHDSAVVPDLRSNPLLLGLLCNIYRGENYIPANRPEVFKKCALMLFERWDKRRGIHVRLPFESRLRPAMQYLAHWIYSDGELQGGVTQSALVTKASKYLHPRRFESEDEAREAAVEFIALCKGRAWVFTDTGSTASGERLFQFTHRTFLEYFTADYLTRSHSGPGALLSVLLPRIERREWDVVSQLAVQLQTEYIEDAADDLLRLILDRADADGDAARVNLTSFAARSLEFLVPSPQSTRRTTAAALALALSTQGAPRPRPGVEDDVIVDETPAEELVAALVSAGAEVRPTVGSEMEAILTEAINRDTEEAGVGRVCELALHINLKSRGAAASPGRQYWADVSDRIASSARGSLERVAERDSSVAYDCVFRGWMQLERYVGLHGLGAAFHYRPYSFWMNVRSMPLAILVIWRRMVVFDYPGAEEDRARFDRMLETLGELLFRAEVPWIRATGDSDEAESWLQSRGRAPRVVDGISPKGAFAVFGVVAVAFELQDRFRRSQFIEKMAAGPTLLSELVPLLTARHAGRDGSESDLDRFGASAPLVEGWTKGQVDFVESIAPGQRELHAEGAPSAETRMGDAAS